MFNRYGPNSLKVSAFIKAIRDLSPEQFATLGHVNYDLDRLEAFAARLKKLDGERETERANAIRDALEAAADKGTEDQRKLAAGLAAILVLEDRLSREEKTFLSLYIIDPTIPLRLLYEEYQKEDFAVEKFCEQLSVIDGENAYIQSRPDERGQGAQGQPDFIINRGGKDFTVEHTSLSSYPKQAHYEKLWADYIETLKIEEKIKVAYPKSLVHVSIPIDAFKSEREAKQFGFEKFMQDLIEAVGKTPIGRNGSKRQIHNLPFPVEISHDDGEGFVACLVARIAPTYREKINIDLEADITRAITKKRKKLQAAKAKGESTILLLDSEDYAFVNVWMLGDAFADAVGSDASVLDGIDDVYILHRYGPSRVVPVKLRDRLYPDLPEFEEYWDKQVTKL